MAFCNRCGTTLPDDARFCTVCGNPCTPNTAAPQDSDFSAPQNTQSGNPYNAQRGTPGGNPHSAPGGTPYGAPGGTPYGAPGGTPYGAPGGNPYGTPGGTPYGTPGGNPYGAPGGNPYSAPYTPPYAPRPETNTAFAARLRNFLVWNNSLLIALIALLASGAVLSLLASVMLDDDAIVSGIFSLILPALTVSGVEMIWQQGKRVGHFPTSGFTMIQVTSIIQAVCMFIVAFFVLIATFAGPSALEIVEPLLGFDTSGMRAALVLVCIILLAVLVVMGVLFIMIANSCASFKRGLLTGFLPRFSGFVVGCLWTFGVLSAIGAFSSLATVGDEPAYSIFSLLSSLCSASSYIVGALIFTKAKQSLSY